jgi:hypothetical protein
MRDYHRAFFEDWLSRTAKPQRVRATLLKWYSENCRPDAGDERRRERSDDARTTTSMLV